MVLAASMVLAAGDTDWYGEAGGLTLCLKIDRRRNSRCRLSAENNEAVIDLTSGDTQIVRWDVATVVAEIEAALQVQEDLWPGTCTNEGWT